MHLSCPDLLSPLKRGGFRHGSFGCGRPHTGRSGSHPPEGVPQGITADASGEGIFNTFDEEYEMHAR
ncbi:MAG TPA: hypothetical protein ENF26_04300 [Methanomicrobia archaeon]|nr:hypothetical protein [Methanomicrobia archaeon]HEX59352.1 hypothetical protein [Methanomicrobia archaeon]